MGASRLLVRVRTQTGHQIPHRLQAHDPILAFCIETPHPASKDPSASVSDELRQDPGSVNLPNLFDKLPPCLGWHMRRIVIRYVQYGEIHAVLFSGRLISRPQRPLLPPLSHERGNIGCPPFPCSNSAPSYLFGGCSRVFGNLADNFT